jgi:hypothetical protein
MADFADGIERIIAGSGQDRGATASHLFRATLPTTSTPAYSCLAETGGRFISTARMSLWTYRNRLPRSHAANARRGEAGSGPLGSLLRGVVDLGCDESKIVVQRTGIPLDEFPFRERSFESRRVAIGAGVSIDREKGLPTTLRAFANFLREYPNATLTNCRRGTFARSASKV